MTVMNGFLAKISFLFFINMIVFVFTKIQLVLFMIFRNTP